MKNPNNIIDVNASTSKKPGKEPLSLTASVQFQAHNEAEEEGEANKPETSNCLPEYSLPTTPADKYQALKCKNKSEKKGDSSRSPSIGFPGKYRALTHGFSILQKEISSLRDVLKQLESNVKS